MRHFIFILITFFIAIQITSLKSVTTSQNYMLSANVIYENYDEILKNIDKKETIKERFTGTVTGYGPDCTGCIGITASGYDVRKTIYYNDLEYGKVFIVAADKKYPFGTIVRFRNIPNKDDFIAIVLDRGSAIGEGKKSDFDILFESEYASYTFGIYHDVVFEILRYGY